jgi:hypothetical protein
LENIIREYKNNGKELTPNNRLDSFFADKFGRNISFFNKAGDPVTFWLGIYYCDEKGKMPYLCLEFNIGQDNLVPKKEAEKIKNIKQGTYSLDPEIWDDVAHFYLTDEYYDILFSNKPDTNEQKEVVLNFLKEIIESI